MVVKDKFRRKVMQIHVNNVVVMVSLIRNLGKLGNINYIVHGITFF